MNPLASSLHVVKVGGSLYDLPDLGWRLRAWLDTLDTTRLIVVPGGGSTVDVIRDLDRRHRLGDDTAHTLALRALSLNGWFLASLLEGFVVTSAPSAHEGPPRMILDSYSFCLTDEGRPGCLPASWNATSDALAARVAVVAGASELVLLKSTDIPSDLTWDEAGQRGLVDPLFAEVLAAANWSGVVRAVNLRAWQPSGGDTDSTAFQGLFRR